MKGYMNSWRTYWLISAINLSMAIKRAFQLIAYWWSQVYVWRLSLLNIYNNLFIYIFICLLGVYDALKKISLIWGLSDQHYGGRKAGRGRKKPTSIRRLLSDFSTYDRRGGQLELNLSSWWPITSITGFVRFNIVFCHNKSSHCPCFIECFWNNRRVHVIYVSEICH